MDDDMIDDLWCGSIVAMTGKECVAIATDLRFGIDLCTAGTDYDKIYKVGPKIFIGYSGLATDAQSVQDHMKFRTNLYELREKSNVSPKVYTTMLSNFLYEYRFGSFYVTPVVAGLDEQNEPYVIALDIYGYGTIDKEFAVCGTNTKLFYGLCETLWKPNLNVDQLFEVISQTLVNGCDRDALSGWGAKVYLIEKDKVTIRRIRTRMD